MEFFECDRCVFWSSIHSMDCHISCHPSFSIFEAYFMLKRLQSVINGTCFQLFSKISNMEYSYSDIILINTF